MYFWIFIILFLFFWWLPDKAEGYLFGSIFFILLLALGAAGLFALFILFRVLGT
jgi:Ca2+/Na+ antiporter